MNDNEYDKAGRNWVHLDPPGMLRWLLPELSSSCTFQRWADTRTVAFPHERERTCDSVAELCQASEPPIWWLLVIELQSKLDKKMFGRMLEYLGRLWRYSRTPGQPRQHYCVAAALVNFRGRGSNSQDFRLPGTPARTCLRIVEKNVAGDDAELTLARIASGDWTRALLPLIPLMRGGKNVAIIDQWKRLAESEPDEGLRDEYASLARVFADLAKRGRIWKQELEGLNMKRSESVMEWQAEAKAEDILDVLQLRFNNELPEDIVARIRGTTDLALLKQWLAAAVKARTLNKFRQTLDT